MDLCAFVVGFVDWFDVSWLLYVGLPWVVELVSC